MVRRIASLGVACALAAAPSGALANGRPPQTMGLHFRPGHPGEVLLAATFGALLSSDGGDTWRWLCETAVGYGGTYDPDYAITAGGVFATTFDGLQVMHDGCQFDTPAQFGTAFAGSVAAGPDGSVYVAMNFIGDATQVPPLPADYKLYKSTDDGATWDAGLMVGTGGETWTSLEVAPSDAQRVYLAGYRLDASSVKVRLLYRSVDGGASFVPLSIAPFEVTGRSDFQIAAISPNDPDRVLLRVTWWNPSGVIGDAFYLTTNGGDAWSKVLEVNDNARGAVFMTGGDAVIGTSRSGIYRSTDLGQSFALLPEPQPDVYCLSEAPDGSLWACTNNYDVAPLDAGIMKTADLVTWTGVMRFQSDIVGPADCPAGSLQQDCCTARVPACPFAVTPEWCFLRSQLGITADPTSCPAAQPDASVAGSDAGPSRSGSCCDVGGQPGAALIVLVVARARRRRRRRSR